MSSLFGGFMNSLNTSTDLMSGAIDIVVIKQPDGTLKCTPFHVRFGRLKLFRSREKVIRIMVNGKLTETAMKIGEAGEAYFVHETHGPLRADLATSPVTSPPASDERIPYSAPGSVNTSPISQGKSSAQRERRTLSGDSTTSPALSDDEDSLREEAAVAADVMHTIAASSNPADMPLVMDENADGDIIFRPFYPSEQKMLQQAADSVAEAASADTNGTSSDKQTGDGATATSASSSPNDSSQAESPVESQASEHAGRATSKKAQSWQWSWGDLPRLLGLKRNQAANGGNGLDMSANASGSATTTPASAASTPATLDDLGLLGEDYTAQTRIGSYKEQQFLEALAKEFHYDAVRKTYTNGASGEQIRLQDLSSQTAQLKLGVNAQQQVQQPQQQQQEKQHQKQEQKAASYAQVARPKPAAAASTSDAAGKSEQRNSGSGLLRWRNSGKADVDEDIAGDVLLADDDDSDGEFDIDTLNYSESPAGGSPTRKHRRRPPAVGVAEQAAGPKANLDERTSALMDTLTPSLPPQMASPSTSPKERSYLAEQMAQSGRAIPGARGKSSSGDDSSGPSSPTSPTKKRSWRSWLGLSEGEVEGGSPRVAAQPVPGTPTDTHTNGNGSTAASPAVAADSPSQQSDKEGSRPRKLSFVGADGGTVYKKSLRPTSVQLHQLNLKEGRNDIQFVVTSRIQGTQEVSANIYLWNHDCKIVVSDVDGTITRSDALGHILPMFGKDWSHEGIAMLYSAIKSNGYTIMYLTSRSIIQAGQTRGYISTLKQGGSGLPEGPVIMAPDRLFQCLAREVITKRPEEFKIAALRDIRAMFPEDYLPYFAGFGNKLNDVIAYRTIGIPAHKIFTIDTTGAIHIYGVSHAGYKGVFDVVHHIFPSIKHKYQAVADGAPSTASKQQAQKDDVPIEKEFLSSSFWRVDPRDLLDEPLEEL